MLNLKLCKPAKDWPSSQRRCGICRLIQGHWRSWNIQARPPLHWSPDRMLLRCIRGIVGLQLGTNQECNGKSLPRSQLPPVEANEAMEVFKDSCVGMLHNHITKASQKIQFIQFWDIIRSDTKDYSMSLKMKKMGDPTSRPQSIADFPEAPSFGWWSTWGHLRRRTADTFGGPKSSHTCRVGRPESHMKYRKFQVHSNFQSVDWRTWY